MEVMRGVGENKYIGSICNGAAISACEKLDLFEKWSHCALIRVEKVGTKHQRAISQVQCV